MGNGSEPPRASRKRRKDSGPDARASLASDCVTFWLRSPDFIIEQAISSAEEPTLAYPVGVQIVTLWPQAATILLPILQAACQRRKPSWNILPAMGPKQRPVSCSCVPLPNTLGEVERIACTFSHGIAERLGHPHHQETMVESFQESFDAAIPLSEFLRWAAQEAKEQTHADLAQIALFSEKEPHELRYEAVAGTIDGMTMHAPVPKGGLSERVILANTPLRYTQQEIANLLRHHPLLPLYQVLDLQAWMGMPLRVAEQCIGLIIVQRTGASLPFSDEDEAQLRDVANRTSIITESRRLHIGKVELAQRELTLQYLLDAMPLLVMHVDCAGRILYINARYTEKIGHQAGDVLPFHQDTPHPAWCKVDDHTPYLWSELPVARAMRSSQGLEEMLLARETAPGIFTSYLAKAQPLYDAQGTVTGAIVVQIDITAQRQAEQRLRQHAAQIDAVIESIQEGIVVYGTDRRPLRFNAAALRIFGWDQTDRDPYQLTEQERQEVYDLRLSNGQPLDTDHRFPLLEALAGNVTAPMEAIVQRVDKKRIIINIIMAPLRDPVTGEIFGAVGAYRDMTEQHSLERMREAFMNMASHELRTPLTSMVLANHIMRQRLRRMADASELLKLNEDMAMQIKRLNRLANNLLDLTSLIGSRFTISPRFYDVAQVIREAAQEMQHSSKRTIILHGLAEPIMAEIDISRISQVIVNLLSNAFVHSSATAPVELDVQLVGEATAPRVQVTVRDHGAGIPQEKLPFIFERFSAIHDDPLASASVVTGSGLGFGLYLSRAIIEAHRGTIRAVSTVGHGSTFTFEIPLVVPKGQQA